MAASKHSRWYGTFCSLIAVAFVVLAAGPSFGETEHPKNCWEVRLQNPQAPDGNYTIEPRDGMVFEVYCSGNKEYLTLVNTGGDFNFSQYTAGGASLGTDVRTNFTKVRIDPLTFLVDMSDMTFSTSTGLLCHSSFSYSCPQNYQVTQMPFGQAADCIGSGAAGRANIDLRGTRFMVQSTFQPFGYFAEGSITVNGVTTDLGWNETLEVQGQVVDFTGGGNCGYNGAIGSYYNNLLQLKWAID